MKKVIILVAMFFTITATADSAKKAIQILSTLQTEIQSSGILQCFEGEDQRELEACVVSLCGPAETAVIAHVNDLNFDFYVKDGVKERFDELGSPVKEAVEKKKENLKNFVEKFRLMQKSGKPILDYTNWESEYETFASSVYSNYLQSTIDTAKPLEDRLTYVIMPPKGASETFINGLKGYAEGKKKYAMQNVPNGLYEGIYTHEEGKNFVTELWKFVFETYKTQIEKNPDFMKDHKSEIDNFINLETFINSDPLGLNNSYLRLYFLKNTILQKLNQPTIELNYDFDCNENCKSGIKEYLSSLKFDEMLQDLEKKASDFKIEDALLSCQAALTLKGLKESEKEAFLKYYPEIKKNFLKKTFSKYSSHSKSTFEKYLHEEVNLSFIREAPSTVDSFFDDLKDIAKRDEPEEERNNSEFLTELLELRDWRDSSKMNPVLDPCDELDGAFLAWDSFGPGRKNNGSDLDPTKDNFEVSLFTCSHESQGKGVISHEIGHALSFAFSKNKLSVESKKEFLRVRECVSASHINAAGAEDEEMMSLFTHKGDTLYTEEDMADVISYKSIDSKGPIFTCALLETNPAGTKFRDLSLVNKVSFDNHSSPLLRILREAIYKEKPLSVSCKQIIEKNQEKFRFQPCL